MLTFLQKNLGTIIVGLVVLAVIVLAVRKIVKDKKSGSSDCGGDCGHCSGCH